MNVRKHTFLFSLLYVIAAVLPGAPLQAQTTPAGYDVKWKTVDSLSEKKGLPESALTIVNNIYTLAKTENNDPQMIRSLIYRMRLGNMNREDNIVKTIQELEKEEKDTRRQPARCLLQNMLACVYWTYFQQNRWKLYGRTNTVNFSKDDIATWTSTDFHRRISSLFLASLEEEKILSATKLDRYDPIIIKGNVRNLRPTLYDLLAHQALGYFMTGEANMDQPASVFRIDDPLAFSDAATFVHHPLPTDDSLSFQFRALQLLARLIRLHLSDPVPDALLDVDIERIRFAHYHAVMSNKDSLYLQALARITDRYGSLPVAAQAWYLQAEQYSQDTVVHGNQLARAICEKVLAEKDSSQGKTNCQVLLSSILQKHLILQTEKINIPNQPIRGLVTWRNFSTLYLRLLRMDSLDGRLPPINYWDDGYWNRMTSLPVFRSFSMSMPATDDYLAHNAEIPIGSLPPGVYALIGSSDPGWSKKNGVIAAQYFYVSSIAYVSHDRDYFVLNRQTGQPLPGATVQLWVNMYNNRTRSTEPVKAESYVTDARGHFLVNESANREYRPRLLQISVPGDQLFLPDATIPPYYPQNEGKDASNDKESFEKKNARTFLFLDRSLYRPAQTLYFKGIVVTKDFSTRQSKVLPDFRAKLFLYNANGGKVDSLELTTNEFGSYHGEFRLPVNLLNGRFRITSEPTRSSQSFTIEEYKRPKFYVAYEKQKGSYRLGDSVRVTGQVKGYAGNVIDGARARYRVVRKTRYTYSWLHWRGIQPSGVVQEIAHGEIKTGADGKFSLVFTAVPDPRVIPSLGAEFDYEVSTDVTDLNGETRSGLTRVTVGYTALKLAVQVPGGDHLPADSLQTLHVTATNLSGEPVNTSIHVSIYPLQSPNRLIRERLWSEPDRWVLTERQFLDSFPHDEYRNESKKESWARGGEVWSGQATTPSQPTTPGQATTPDQAVLHIPGGRVAPGWYVIEAVAIDKYGQEAKDLRYVELYNGATGEPANPQYIWAPDPEQTAQPGGKVRIGTGTSAGSVYCIRVTERNNNGEGRAPGNGQTEAPESFSSLILNKEKKSMEREITEADRGGFGISDMFIKDNRQYTHLSVVKVPWTNKELQIRYATYRDKTEPGQEEKWQMVISGDRKEKASAEIMTAMYDASLDQFMPHYWITPSLYPVYRGGGRWQSWTNFTSSQSQEKVFDPFAPILYSTLFDRLQYSSDDRENFFSNGFSAGRFDGYQHDMNPDIRTFGKNLPAPGIRASLGASPELLSRKYSGAELYKDTVAYSSKMIIGDAAQRATAGRSAEEADQNEGATPQPDVQIRKNFNETAFFFPDLRTDSAGNVSFSFTMPEALTRWKWLTLTHTRDASFGYDEKEVVTQKKLMVQPNAPRFLREGDRMELGVKVVNLTDSEMTGQMALQLTDPTTGQTADGWFVNRQPNQYFTVAAGQSAVVNFPLDIPYQYNRPLTYRVTAQARNYSDGEEATLPVVSNRMLVTETLPLNMSGDGIHQFTFDKLLKSGSSETLNHHALTVEFTTNPAWYAVQALPYLTEYPYECAEQIFNRFYANALAAKIAGSSPRLQQIFSKWRTEDTAALLSNLQKNQELKSVLLEETPWVLQGKSESQQKKNIALLFDMDRMSRELSSALDKLTNMQSSGGGFVWFKGGPDDRYITQYILTGIGHLQKLQALPPALAGKIKEIVTAALPYLDDRIREDYEEEKKWLAAGKGKPGTGPRPIRELPVQYLYMRSLFSDYGLPGNIFPAVNYYRKQAQQYWVQCSKYMQGMISLALFRTGDVQTARNILASLRQNAIRDEEKGMYWKGMEGGYYWYQAPVETQSLLIEAFHDIGQDAAIERDLKTWLLKQKQTHNWPTTKATADACYALLLGGADWLTAERSIGIKLGDKTVAWTGGGTSIESGLPAGGLAGGNEAGTGYNKKVFDGPFVNPSMGNITVTMETKPEKGAGAKPGESPAWGAVYWQYFDQLDHITPAAGNKMPLKLVKKLFIQRNTDRGPVLEPLAENGTLKVGDKVKVRIELQSDRDLEYVHMKDMRAACMEPTNVISQYKWQGGLGYYESTKDVSTDFFFSVLPRGTYVFEYTLFAGQAGNFSNGITNIECMYAPEFAFHSEGIRVNVEAAP